MLKTKENVRKIYFVLTVIHNINIVYIIVRSLHIF